MEAIQLGKIIENNNLDKREIAEQLFPTAKYPLLALNRIIESRGVLDSNQIGKLSVITGIALPELFEGHTWRGTLTGNLHTFISGDYKAELDTEKWVTKLYHNNSLFHTYVLHKSSITLSDYLTKLNELVTKYKKAHERRNQD